MIELAGRGGAKRVHQKAPPSPDDAIQEDERASGSVRMFFGKFGLFDSFFQRVLAQPARPSQHERKAKSPPPADLVATGLIDRGEMLNGRRILVVSRRMCGSRYASVV